jgi:hypothetical protein
MAITDTLQSVYPSDALIGGPVYFGEGFGGSTIGIT